MSQSPFETIAAVDLGSNSFRLQIVRVVDDQFYTLDSLKDTVRLGGGLTADNHLDQETQDRALACLARFGERLRGFSPDAVRVVGTNTLRVSKNADAFIAQAEALLGFPIEIIAGREEARLIYMGAAHSLPVSRDKRLVIDIGGGSTEFIIGAGLRPLVTESLNLGCVTYSYRYFPGGKVTKAAFRDAELAARNEIQRIAYEYDPASWVQAIGTSGTARALRDIVDQNFSESYITLEGMERIRAEMIATGDARAVSLKGLRAERAPVLPGGLAIMMAVFQELKIERMQVTDGALREGVLYDLLGRNHLHDLRDATVKQFKRRYHIDSAQAERVAGLASIFLNRMTQCPPESELARRVNWAAKLHEIGLSISHSAYHKHSAYIVEYADMPGFSRREQKALALLVLAHKGSLTKLLSWISDPNLWQPILALRLAVIFARSRNPVTLPEGWLLESNGKRFTLTLDRTWLEQNPMTATALKQEAVLWKAISIPLSIEKIGQAEMV